MRGHKITRMQFIIVSCLGLAVILSLSQLAELRYEQEMLRDEIIDLSGVYEKNRTLAEQLQAVREQIVLLRQRNQSLEELLSNRVRTYLIATGSLPAGTAEGFYPSRSGLRAATAPLICSICRCKASPVSCLRILSAFGNAIMPST